MPLSYNVCPFQPTSTITPVGETLPLNACSDKCALFLRAADPRTGKPLPGGACTFSALTVQIANLIGMLQVVQRREPAAEPSKPA